MYRPVESVIHPENRQGAKRLFVIEGLEQDRVLGIAKKVMDIYGEVTGRQFSDHELQDFPVEMMEDLRFGRFHEFRFRMPKLDQPANSNGKLFIRGVDIILAQSEVSSAAFWLDTNDYDRVMNQPEASRLVTEDFDSAIREMADTEYVDIGVPLRKEAFSSPIYNPSSVGILH